MSWYCNAYVEIKDSHGKWYMLKDCLELVSDANFYLTPWAIDGDPLEVDWLDEEKYENLSESLRREYSEAPSQYCYHYANSDTVREKCLEILRAALEREYVAFRAMGFDCTIDGDHLEFSREFQNSKHTGPCTFPVDKSIILELREALEKKDRAERLLGVLDTIADRDQDLKFNKRIVFVRSF